MNRLQKKCLLASAGVHALPLVLLLTGVGFVSQPPPLPHEDAPIINFIAFKTVDEQMTGGGSPNARALPPAPPDQPITKPAPEPEPAPAPEPAEPAVKPEPAKPNPEPEPTKPEPKPERSKPELKLKPKDPDSLESSNKKSKKNEFVLKPIVRNSDGKAEAKARAAAREREEREAARAEANDRRRIAARFSSAVNSLSGLSTGTEIALLGPGGGGVPYANFEQAVRSVYDRAWTVPDGVTDDEAAATATITIGRDGTVLHARISQSSGNAAVDRSVRSVLDRVKWAAPLPEKERENQRTLKIKFNVSAKRGLG
jgi:TonB family protein